MAVLLASAQLLGYLAERLFIPRVIGEVGAGLVWGPTVLGSLFPQQFHQLFLGFPTEDKLFAIISQLGLILLMFCSGLQFHTSYTKDDAKISNALIVFSTTLPFLFGWISTYVFDFSSYAGSSGSTTALKIVISLSIAVTSVPVISKIFFDLGIIHSRFSKLIITIAGIHDVFLWVALGIATSMAGYASEPTFSGIAKQVLTVFIFIALSLLLLTQFFKIAAKTGSTAPFRPTSIWYALFAIFVVCTAAGFLHVEVMFGALIAGIAAKLAITGKVFRQLEDSITHISFSWFIPVYFAIVGMQLDLTNQFHLLFFLKFLLFATLTLSIIVYLTCRCLKLDRLTSLNFGVAMNARGGPGIVLSTVAYSAGIINQSLFATLVMLALVTSWFAGTWLRIVTTKGWRLMPGDELLEKKKASNGEADKK